MASTSDGTACEKEPDPDSKFAPPAQLCAVDTNDEDGGGDDDGRPVAAAAAAAASAAAAAAAAAESSSAPGTEPTTTAIASTAPAHVSDTIAAASEPPTSPPARPSTPSPSRHPPDSIPLTRSSAEPDQTQQQQQPSEEAETAMTDPYAPPLTPFMASSMANMDRQTYMMMALVSATAAKRTPPPTVTPSQVTLPNPADGNHLGLYHGHGLARHAASDNGLESFSRIEFADSVFQMTTHSVIIGRDQRALEQARLDEKRTLEHRRRVEENASKGLPPPSPIRHDRCKFSKSYVSEEGGMLGPESDSEDSGRPPKRRKTSSGPSSYVSNDDAQDSNIISDRQYVSHTPGAAAVDLTNLRPSPSHTPFIGIHSPGPDIAVKTKAISREHLKIAYNEEIGVFEAIPLHKNGFFCEDVHHKSDTVVLRCGDRLQIKDVGFRFIINGVERGFTGAEDLLEEEAAKQEEANNGGKEMSFDFEQSHGDGKVQYSSDDLSEMVSPPELSDLGDAAEPGPERREAETGDQEQAPGPDPALPSQPPKKRGPGRPPKNGVMSKREQRLLKKQQQQQQLQLQQQQEQQQLEQLRLQQQRQQEEGAAADEALSRPPLADEPPLKRKVGRPRKHPLPEEGGDRPEKRRYKPRKPKNEDGAVGSDAERRAREKKDKKARPKSPPLELKIEDYSEEQLQKPSKNYGILIDETLTAAGADGLTLKQIYKRICQRYPWFYFHTETKGWESSVRHNLIGNEAFKKDESTNLWSRVPGVELDAGKKRKVASPDRVLAAQQAAYGPYACTYGAAQQQQQQMPASGYAPGYHPMPGFSAQSTRPPPPPPLHPPPPPPPHPPPHPPHPPPPSSSAPTPSTRPVSQQLIARPPGPPQVQVYGPPPPAPAPARTAVAGAHQPGAYSSPYASRPPALAPTPVKVEGGVPATAPPAPMVPPSPANVDAVQKAAAGRGSKTAPAAARPVVDQRLLQAVVDLKNGLIDNLKRAHNPQAEAIVMSALNRVIGLKQGPGSNDNLETICMKGISQVIQGYLEKNVSKSAGAGGSSSSSSSASKDPPTMLDAQVLKSLNGFKMVSVKALKVGLGEARAEDMTLSAIDRVLGLAEGSFFAPPTQNNGKYDGVEQHLMKSIRQLLVGMNQQLFRSPSR